MAKMACWIIVTVSAFINVSTLVSTYFIKCKVLSFQMKATVFHVLVRINTKSLSADGIIRTLKNKCRTIKAQLLCSPSESKKVETEDDLAGLNMAMKNLVEAHKRG